MNNKEFITELAARAGYTNQQAQRLLTTTTTLMSECFAEGDSLNVSDFGTFEVKKRNERIIFNPATGKRMLVPPKLTQTFKPATAWKEKVREKENTGRREGGETV